MIGKIGKVGKIGYFGDKITIITPTKVNSNTKNVKKDLNKKEIEVLSND